MSSQISFRKTQLAIALTAALASASASALTVIPDDVQVVGDGDDSTPNVIIGTVTTKTTDTPAPGAPEVTLPSVPSGVTTIIYTVTGDDASTVEETVATGGATVDNSGNVKLSGGYTETQTTTFDLATRVVINSDPTAPPVKEGDACTPANFGCVISSTPNVVGTWSGTNDGTFTEGMPEPDEAVKVVQPGGNLDMTGDLTVGGSANLNGPVTTNGDVSVGGALGVTGATTTAGITNTGSISTDTISADEGGSITALQTDSGLDKGLTVNASGASLTGDQVTIAGGSGTTTVTVNNSGVNVNDSTNGQTFALSNQGDVTVRRDLTVGSVAVPSVVNVTGATTLNASAGNRALTVNASDTTAMQVNGVAGQLALDVNGAMHVDANSGNTTLYADANGVNATGNGAALAVNGGTASLTNSSGTYVRASGNAARMQSQGGWSSVEASGTSAGNSVARLGANNSSVTAGSNYAQAVGNNASMYVSGTDASLTNSNGRGLVVSQNATQLSGGTGTSYLTLNNSGATFSSNSNGTGPVRVTGVADGVNQYDAVNYGQVQSAYSSLKRDISDVEDKANAGVAAAVALAGIPAPAAGKQYTVGIGWGNYESENAFALGGRAQITPEFQLTAGWGYSNEGNAFNVGAGYSW